MSDHNPNCPATQTVAADVNPMRDLSAADQIATLDCPHRAHDNARVIYGSFRPSINEGIN